MADSSRRKASAAILSNILKVVRNHPETPITDYEEAVTLLERCEVNMSKCERAHDNLVALCTSDEALAVQIDTFELIEQDYRETKSKLNTIIKQLTPATTIEDTSEVVSRQSLTHIKLPALELPTFDGDYANWPSFKDLFIATVDCSESLAPSHKLQYLKSSLKGEPGNLIKSLIITDAHYEEAWGILKERYDNTREIVSSLISKILNYKPIQHENPHDLQKLLDNTHECLSSLKVLQQPVKYWDSFLIVLHVNKLDSGTRREWAVRQPGTTLPTFKEFTTFLSNHIRGLTAASAVPQQQTKSNFERNLKVHLTGVGPQCTFCRGPHFNNQCQEFISLSPTNRLEMAKKHVLCTNCLRANHRATFCRSGTCRKCNQKHHTLLHFDKFPPENTTQASSFPTQGASTEVTTPATSSTNPNLQMHHINVSGTQISTNLADATAYNTETYSSTQTSDHFTEILLPTAISQVEDGYGNLQPCRIFLDQGSQATLITEECVQRLRLPRQFSRSTLTGAFFTNGGRTKGKVSLVLHNFYSNTKLYVEAHITSKFTGNLPTTKLPENNLLPEKLPERKLADPRYHIPAPVDILLGAEYVARVKLLGKHVGPANKPIAEETVFGWILSGRVESEHPTTVNIHHISTLDDILRKFWEMEESPTNRILTKEERTCEDHFQTTYRRDTTGRFYVHLPFNDKKAALGASRETAIRRFLQVEKRLQRDQQYRQQYVDFMREYESLGHMELVPHGCEEIGSTYYLPHHFVVNAGSTTTKLRVVFDGSAKTTGGVSLNDTLLVGPTIQEDIFKLLLRFRSYKIVLKADITKMFRQFYLHQDDANFHRIVWRESPDKQIQDYRLLTVTYGTACAPYLSTRCLQQLAHDVRHTHPAASKALLNDCYVDDLMSGGESVEEVTALYLELTKATGSASLELRKWSSSSSEVLQHIPPEMRETNPLTFDSDLDQTIKALGLQWNPSTDVFTFKFITPTTHKTLTKRILLSDLARVYDPLGFVSCVTVRAKLQLQELWRLQIDWDDEVPEEVANVWWTYQEDLRKISSLEIPRYTMSLGASYELHGFADASEKAYGAIVYLRAILPKEKFQTLLITSKSKVAPLRQVALPRLELNSAELLAELITHVKNILKLDCPIFCWSDSSITLHWIAGEPRKWQTYVANRVAKIQELTPLSSWRHVPGKQNPADLVSRGITCEELISSSAWWNGPDWLSQKDLPTFPVTLTTTANLEERKPSLLIHHASTSPSWSWSENLLRKFSSLNRLKRVTAYILRWRYNFRNKSERNTGTLSVKELQNAMNFWIRHAQSAGFPVEYTSLKKSIALPKGSKLLHLFPYLDRENITRIGGQLDNIKLPESKRHQIILPPDSHLTYLLVSQFHHNTFHGGFQLTFSRIQAEYWIIRGRDKVRHYIRSCVICRRHRANTATQLMGSLPPARVTPSRPFLHTGVDYAGPYTLKNPIGRAPKTYKGYLCIFVCMSTKAIHLEAVSDLSTDGFIAAMRRFVARRGLCAHIYSDCGTNFIGAEKEIQRFLRQPQVNNELTDEMSSKGITFHFNPPSSPHQGGLWEAGVKSAKHHLRRTMGKSTTTYEQFATFLCQIEAILNSRPLSPMSSDPTDFSALTPGHFLIGEPLIAVPDVNLSEIRENRLSKFQQQQQRVQHFWRRWSDEYLNTLQQRNKWYIQQNNLKLDDLVLIKEETNPLDWKLGRVIELFPGNDQNIRTVTIRTTNGEYKRPIAKFWPSSI